MLEVFRLHECSWHPPQVRSLTPFPVPANVAEQVSRWWVRMFPEDIVWLHPV